MEIEFVAPQNEGRLREARAFLSSLGLGWDRGIQSTVNLVENGEIAATGSREYNVLKCIGVSPALRGRGLAAALLTELVRDALEAGFRRLFLYTKPENIRLFRGLGFYEVVSTADAVLMENECGGIGRFVESVRRPSPEGASGCIVANCDPFTNGHLRLVEQAAAACGLLYLFILSEQRSRFSAEARLALAKAGTAHLANVAVAPTGGYLVSAATFPDYFLKEKVRREEVACSLDVKLFAERFAGPLGVTKRFVGTEPFCPVTRAYNGQMKAMLTGYGIEVVELPRLEIEGEAVSASRVRALFDGGNLEAIRPLVPKSTYRFLERMRAE